MAENEVDYDVFQLTSAQLAVATAEGADIEIVKPMKRVGAITVIALPVEAIGKVHMRWGNGKFFQLRAEGYPHLRIPARTDGAYLKIDAGIVTTDILQLQVGFAVLADPV